MSLVKAKKIRGGRFLKTARPRTKYLACTLKNFDKDELNCPYCKTLQPSSREPRGLGQRLFKKAFIHNRYTQYLSWLRLVQRR